MTICTSSRILESSILFSVPFPSVLRVASQTPKRECSIQLKVRPTHPQRPLLPARFSTQPQALSSQHIRGGPRVRVRPRAQRHTACPGNLSFTPAGTGRRVLDVVFMKSCSPALLCVGAVSLPPATIFCCPIYVCPVGHGHSDQVNYICVIK